jgi:hypothetical protein
LEAVEFASAFDPEAVDRELLSPRETIRLNLSTEAGVIEKRRGAGFPKDK